MPSRRGRRPRTLSAHNLRLQLESDRCWQMSPSTGAYAYAASLGLLIALTNQFHKWAHVQNPPTFVKLLQDLWLILPRKHHSLHHRVCSPSVLFPSHLLLACSTLLIRAHTYTTTCGCAFSLLAPGRGRTMITIASLVAGLTRSSPPLGSGEASNGWFVPDHRRSPSKPWPSAYFA